MVCISQAIEQCSCIAMYNVCRSVRLGSAGLLRACLRIQIGCSGEAAPAGMAQVRRTVSDQSAELVAAAAAAVVLICWIKAACGHRQ